jgi:hypothetical protein
MCPSGGAGPPSRRCSMPGHGGSVRCALSPRTKNSGHANTRQAPSNNHHLLPQVRTPKTGQLRTCTHVRAGRCRPGGQGSSVHPLARCHLHAHGQRAPRRCEALPAADTTPATGQGWTEQIPPARSTYGRKGAACTVASLQSCLRRQRCVHGHGGAWSSSVADTPMYDSN